MSENGPVCIVGIGASAGGISAIRTFFYNLQSFERSALVIVQHLDANGKQLALDILSHLTSLPVKLLEGKCKILPGHVYLVPPHHILEHEGETLHVRKALDNESRSTIDSSFEALASFFRHNSVGIILSGDGSDGTEGLKKISNAGGLTIAQDLETSEHSSMPQSAISSGIVDHILNPQEMPAELKTYEEYLRDLNDNSNLTHLHNQIGASLGKICDILQTATHHDFKHYKTTTLIRRIVRRMQVLQVETVVDYLERLEHHDDEIDSLFKELLINVTSFFRDPEAFETLNSEVLTTGLTQVKHDQRFRIWIPGCSTGEEVYTIAILVKEALEKMETPPEVQIIATDIDEHALGLARRGAYSVNIEQSVSRERLSKYFVRRGGKYHVTKELRELCLFSSHNLINDPPFSHLDLISCRNVLIYLGSHLQKKLIPVFHYALKPGGHLFLGNSESLSAHRELFKIISTKHRLAQRKSTVIRPPTSFSTSISTVYASHIKEVPHNHEADLHMISQRIILDEFSPRYAVINDDCQIQSVSGGIQEYLEPTEGAFQNNILRLVKSELRMALRSAISDARTHKRRIDHESASLKTENGVKRIGIVVQPMPKLGEESSLYMVVFQNFGIISTEDRIMDPGTTFINTALIEQLERELASTREDLDKTVQDLEASNEELKSSNEELLSMNEELQSANEELETSKEEIQISNEAYQKAVLDLETLLNSTDIATLFLDKDLRITNFTPRLSEIYKIKSVDLGREITDLATLAVNMPPYEIDSEVKEEEIRLSTGKVFLRRVVPFKNEAGKKSGMVVAFIDVSELRGKKAKIEAVFEGANAAMVIFRGRDLVYERVNPEYIRVVGKRDLLGKKLEDAIPEITSGPIPELLRKVFDTGVPHKGSSVHVKLKNPETGKLEDHYFDNIYRRVEGPDGNPYGVFAHSVDVTEKVIARKRAEEAEETLMVALESADMGSWTFDPATNLALLTPRASELFGLDHNDLPFDLSLALFRIHPDDVEKVRSEIAGALDPSGNGNYRITYRVLQKNNSYKWINVKGRARFGGNPRKAVHFAGVMYDITDQKNIEASLIESEEKFKTIANAMPQMLWSTLPDGYHDYYNDRWYQYTGVPYGSTDGQGWNNMFHPEDQERAWEVWRRSLETGEHYEIEYRLKHHSGNYRWVLGRALPVRNESGKIIRWMGTCTDIHDLRETEMKLKAALASRDEFLSVASHELKTPLTSLIIQTQLQKRLLERGDERAFDPEKNLETYTKFERLFGRLNRLVDDMLDISRINFGKLVIRKERCDLYLLAEEVMARMNTEINAAGINVTIKGDHVSGDWDPLRLEQVITNLLTNAIRYGNKKPVEISVGSEGKTAVLEVIDYGMGISEVDQSKIFERFERAVNSDKISGLGLGLFISKEIVTLHGGTITLKSNPGEGSTFTVRLPGAE